MVQAALCTPWMSTLSWGLMLRLLLDLEDLELLTRAMLSDGDEVTALMIGWVEDKKNNTGEVL